MLGHTEGRNRWLLREIKTAQNNLQRPNHSTSFKSYTVHQPWYSQLLSRNFCSYYSSVEMSLHKTTEPLDRERTIQEEGRKIMMNRPRKDENRDPYSGQRREGRGQMTSMRILKTGRQVFSTSEEFSARKEGANQHQNEAWPFTEQVCMPLLSDCHTPASPGSWQIG